MSDDILADRFHRCALRAFLTIWAESGHFPPDSEATRRLAYRLYEDALAKKNRRREPQAGRPPRREAGQGCAAPLGDGSQRNLTRVPIES